MQNTRIVFIDGSNVTDITPTVGDYNNQDVPLSFVAGQSKLLIGSRAPFNHIYMKLGSTLNTENATMKVSYWDGLKFVEFVDVNDRTEALKKDGFVYVTPDKDKLWTLDDTDNENNDQLEQLFNGLVIYDRFWMQIEFDIDLTANVDLSWIGQIFSNDSDLESKYPNLNDSRMKEGFKVGKTTWEEQHVLAAQEIVDDLIDSFTIKHKQEILDPAQLKTASVHKVASIILTPFGQDYRDDRDDANRLYRSSLNKLKPRVDLNGDGRLNPREYRTRQRHMSR